MRNLLTIGIIALAAFAIISCDGFEAPGTEAPVVINENGQTLVEINLGVSEGNARALHSALAQAGADYYEVVFDNGGSIHRTVWREGGTARLGVTPGTYDNDPDGEANYAYIFAGRFSDMTLLAVGTISTVVNNGVAETSKTITTSTTGVNFVLNALETNVNHATDSTLVNTNDEFTPLASASQWQIERVDIDGKEDIPVFMVPADAVTYATFGYTLSASALSGAINVRSAGTITALSYILYGNNEAIAGSLGTGGSVAITVETGKPLPTKLPITITTGNDGVGLMRVFFSVPVYNHSTATTHGSAATTWYYRGGLNNALVDLGHSNLSLGGAFLIGVGDAFGDGGEGTITMNPGY